jgi:hypothetical protein
MATRRDETDSVKKKAAPPARKTVPAKKAAPRKTPAARKAAGADSTAARPKEEASQAAGPKGLLRAGLKALGTVRDDVVKHQTNVIESLLGIGKTDPAGGKFPGLDTFGIRKFEDVFDQRVATSLERLGMPSAKEFQELREQMRLLLEHVERLESDRRKR